MELDDLQWLAGSAVALFGTFSVLLWGVFKLIASRKEEVRADASAKIDQLHERIKRVRDDLSGNYVRRADLDGHLAGC